jgi:hypothetical protein
MGATNEIASLHVLIGFIQLFFIVFPTFKICLIVLFSHINNTLSLSQDSH